MVQESRHLRVETNPLEIVPSTGQSATSNSPLRPRRRQQGRSHPIKPLKLPDLSQVTAPLDVPVPPSSEADSTAPPSPPVLSVVSPHLPISVYPPSRNRRMVGKQRCLQRTAAFSPRLSASDLRRLAGSTLYRLHRSVDRTLIQPVRYQIATLPRPSKEFRQWATVWFAVVGTLGGVGAVGLLLLASPPPSANCSQVNLQSPEVQRLACAQQQAASGKLEDLVAAIALLQTWSAEQPLYTESQTAIVDWSRLILLIARDRMAVGDLEGAVVAAQQVPPDNAVYADAQEAVRNWKQEWQKGEAILAMAETAIRDQNWKLASQQVTILGYLPHEYWRIQQADILFKRIVVEKQARLAVNQAQKLAKSGQPNDLGDAILLVREVDPNTLAAPDAQTALAQWSQTLINYGIQRWQQGDRDTAVAVGLKIPLDANLPAAGRDLIRFSQAQQLADSSLTQQSTPKPTDLWGLTEAIAAVRTIPTDSPLYPEAQMALTTWQSQVHDLVQLLWATEWATLGDRPSLEFAITQAEQIDRDRPRRIQAQSLIAEWQQIIRQLEDRPYLVRAQRWAATGKIPDLEAAIEQIRQIPTHRPAWQKAQTLIMEWTRQIQIVEDQPILDRAQALAKQGKLPEAIEYASQIPADRALYEQAQTAIQGWQTTIRNTQLAEDQPVLDRAYALAAQQHLTQAIDVASQIAPGRALYGDAQSAIKEWAKVRDDIWRGWENEPAVGSDSESLPVGDMPVGDAPVDDMPVDSAPVDNPGAIDDPADAAVSDFSESSVSPTDSTADSSYDGDYDQ